MKSLTALAACCAIGLPVAFGETFTYTWDGTSESYGDGRVAVGYAGDAVATLTAKVAEGDTVVFEGETPVSFAADATVKVDGRGSLTFSNDVAAAGALVFTSDAPRLSFDITKTAYDKSTLSTGGPEVLAFPGVMNLADYVHSAQDSVIQYNGSTRRGGFEGHCPVRTEGSYSYQIQNWYSTAKPPRTMCILLKFIQRDEGVALTNEASWAVYGREVVGEDFLALSDKGNENYQILETMLVAERVAGRREVTFAGAFSAGGTLMVAGGVTLCGTAKAFKTENNGTFDAEVAFDSGALSFLECGDFTNAATFSGNEGDVYYLSPDGEEAGSKEISVDFEHGTLGTTDVLALQNVNLQSVVGLSMKADWRDYSTKNVISVATNSADKAAQKWVTDMPAMYYQIDPWMETPLAVARFQGIASNRGVSQSIPLVLKQVGRDVYVHAEAGRMAWHSNWPNGEASEPMTWDPWSGAGTTGGYTINVNIYVTNLTFRLTPLASAFPNTISIAGSCSAKRLNSVFRPGAGRLMEASVSKYPFAASSSSGFIHVCDRATLRLCNQGASPNWSQGVFGDNTVAVARLLVHPGGRILTQQQKTNSSGQRLFLEDCEYRFTSNTPTASYSNGKLNISGATHGETLFNYVGSIAYSEGACTSGMRTYIGSQYLANPVLSVTGSKPCRAENGFYVNATGGTATRLTFDIANATGDAEADFTTASVTAADADLVSFVKKGDGTLLLSEVNIPGANPFEIAAGTVELGCSGCLGETAALALTGGSLAVAAGTENTLQSLAISADTTLTLGDGATLTVTDPTAEWATDMMVNIVGDPKTCTLKFGDETGSLSSRQFRRIRWNGEKCHVEEDGTVVPGALGMVLLLR